MSVSFLKLNSFLHSLRFSVFSNLLLLIIQYVQLKVQFLVDSTIRQSFKRCRSFVDSQLEQSISIEAVLSQWETNIYQEMSRRSSITVIRSGKIHQRIPDNYTLLDIFIIIVIRSGKIYQKIPVDQAKSINRFLTIRQNPSKDSWQVSK